MATHANLKRQLHFGMHGRDVLAVQHALKGTGDYDRPKPTSIYGQRTIAAVEAYQKRHNLPVHALYDRATHHSLVTSKGWDGFCDWLMNSVVLPKPNHRKDAVSAFMYAYSRRPLHYTMSSGRDDWLQLKAHIPHYPRQTDCSGMFHWCYWTKGLIDPSNYSWRAVGWTGSMIEHGRRVSSPGIADAVFYGVSRIPSHVAMYVGNGMVLSHGHEGGPSYLPVNEMGITIHSYRSYL